ncbi:hypothetical protein [Metabacillus fastidiosus]|uniref:hypothetical protein n=1 Tax=Metabacillus fastidiosus TaxID=1458 RepID=UPI003D2C9666
MIDINKIKPKVKDESDKYSWNLYNFLNRLFNKSGVGKYYKKQLEIHWLHNSRWDGSYLEFNKDKLNLNQILILPSGKQHYRGTFYELSLIMGKGKATEFALPYSYETTDITEWFFNTYERDGRCIFDREHNGWWQGDKERFTYINNTRKCNWCGEWHKKEIKKVQVIKREETWV